MPSPTTTTPEELLQHAAFLQRLAFTLVTDPGTQDDVVQDTWVSALRHPPEKPGRAWFATVLRNAVRKSMRTQSRRVRREHVAARPEHILDTASAAADDELRREVVAAVLALSPATRDVVLRRFYDNETPTQIAAALDVPLNTVKSRLRRGLVALRGELNHVDPTWRASGMWGLASTALGTAANVTAVQAAPAATVAGATAMSSVAKVCIAGAVCALTAAGAWYVSEGASKNDDLLRGLTVGLGKEPPSLLVGAQGDLQGKPIAVEASDSSSLSARNEYRLHGSVVDEAGEPVVLARVRATYGGRVIGMAETSEAGTYFMNVARTEDWTPTDRGRIVASGDDDLVGVTTRHVPPLAKGTVATGRSEIKAQTITVRPAQSLRVLVNRDCAGDRPATVWIAGSGWDSHEAIAKEVLPESGTFEFEGIPHGTWRVIAAAPGCGRDVVVVKLPQVESHQVQLTIPDSHELTIRVREHLSRAPIANARITVRESGSRGAMRLQKPLMSTSSEYTSNEHGDCVIKGLGGAEALVVQAAAMGFPPPMDNNRRDRPGQVRLKPGATECVIELHRPRTVRWPIEDKGHGVPSNGSLVRLEPLFSSGAMGMLVRGTIQNGEIVVEGLGPGVIVALAYVEGLGAARVQTRQGELVGFKTAFFPLRKIELVAKNAGGKPLKGAWFWAKDGGHNRVGPAVKTNDEGYAVMEGLYSGLGSHVACYLSLSRGSLDTQTGFGVGTVQLDRMDGRFEFQVPAERTMRATFLVGDDPPPKGLKAHMRLGHKVIELAPNEEGVCDVSFSVSKSTGQLTPMTWTGGYRIAEPIVVDLKLKDPIDVQIRLEKTHQASIKVLLPRDGLHSIVAQRWDSSKQAWIGDTSNLTTLRQEEADANGVVTLTGLTSGRYRAVDRRSKESTPEFTVGPGVSVINQTIDLSRAGWVKGRVIPPQGMNLEGFIVGARGESLIPNTYGGAARRGTPVDRSDGTFWFRCIEGKPVTLRIFHSTCRPHPTKGYVTIRGPREDVTLHAVRGATATLTLSKPVSIYLNRGQKRSVAVRLYENAVRGKGTRVSGTLNGRADQVEIGGYEPGVYTLWIDLPSAQPIIVPNATLTDKDVDLGTVTPNAGSSFKLTVKVKRGQSPPDMSIFATKLGEPTCFRRGDGSGSLSVRGLGKGRFRVEGVEYTGTGGTNFNEVIEFDGETDVERVIDLR